MFNDLFWALYWIDVFSSVGNLVGIPIIFCGLAAFGMLLYSIDHNPNWNALWWVFGGSIVIAFLTMLVPSKQTMYMMLGVKMTDNVVNSDLGKKLQQIVDAEVDEYLKKFKPVEKK